MGPSVIFPHCPAPHCAHPAAHLQGALCGRGAHSCAAQAAQHGPVAGTGGDQRQQVERQQVVESEGALQGAAGEDLAAVGAWPRGEAVQGEHWRRHGRRACTTGAAEHLAGDQGREEPGPRAPRCLPSARPQCFCAKSAIAPISQRGAVGGRAPGAGRLVRHPVWRRPALTQPDAQADGQGPAGRPAA